MKLHSITLANFRQFQGVQSFDLSSDSKRTVSMLFGANGAGKTTFLNAFTWALYGEMSDDVEKQDVMVTDKIWHALAINQSVELSVELFFDHAGRNLRLLRRATLWKESEKQPVPSPEVQLWTTNPDGSSEVVQAPQQMIHTILPKGLSRFFFFNGERIEKLVQKAAYTEVQKDIKFLLDLEHVERALQHLPAVDRRLTNELKKHGGKKASEIQAAIDQLRDSEAPLRNELKELEEQIATLGEERETVLDLLRQHESAAPIQAQRDVVSKELDDAEAALQEALTDRAVLVATRSFLAFTRQLEENTQSIADGLYQKGALPAPLKREFVEKLIEDGECICGTPLTEGADPLDKVRDWRQRAGLQAVESAWQKLSGQIEPLASARTQVRDDLSALTKRISDQRDRKTRLAATLSELVGKLSGSSLEDVQALETKRIDLDRRRDAKQQRVGIVTTKLQQIDSQIEQKTRERSRAEVTDELALKARSRSDAVQSVQRALKEILAIREETIRKRLDKKLKSVFARISHQNHVPTLDKGLELTLHKQIGGITTEVPKSTGENQILSLSFVAAVSQLARELRQEKAQHDPARVDDSGIYPIVMDAAFGSLDQDYQKAVSKVLAEMAPQLVVLVSKSQGLGTVLNELAPYISNLGVIETHTTKPDQKLDHINLNGTSSPFTVPSESDYSELKVIQSWR
ncbi:AAA family ATPase [Nocardia sp. NEAU-G5]|uniref:Nuclease SbcCD subunit C n=1 Tax=Nocardia albiluteola TaxID=2842303 RepID=A0ABS6AZT1_9NOCA|nr:AAA family ATPase [Nocardia albiluteola]MBU3063561.1 AAA family ATPase [Nocardia albiluteola]